MHFDRIILFDYCQSFYSFKFFKKKYFFMTVLTAPITKVDLIHLYHQIINSISNVFLFTILIIKFFGAKLIKAIITLEIINLKLCFISFILKVIDF